MNLHFWRQDGFETAGLLGDLNYPAPIQTLRCERCGEIISVIDCGKKTCQTLLSLGCSNELPPKEKWQAPIKEKAVNVNTRDYPAKRRAK